MMVLGLTRLSSRARPDGLHGRARLEGVGQRAIAQLLARQVLAMARVVAGIVRQGQQLAGVRIHDHHAACLGLEGLDLLLEFLVGVVLDLAVDGQLNILPILRRAIAHALHHTAQTILDHTTRASLAG
jgi:hypothetical protein